MIQRFNAIGLVILVLLTFFAIGDYVGNKYGVNTELVKEQREVIDKQRNLIEILEANNDSLRVTRTEFDNAVKLLESKK